ncbi:MAG TPA: hypothetical protein VIE43_01555 [Thermoanaerobaculia bacterium]|nr:hypothetical protein [Thermoanaerobaculia bacterium]
MRTSLAAASAALSMALLLAMAAVAAPVPAGPNFQVNQVTARSQNQPDVAQDDAGDFAIVWSDGPPPLSLPSTVKIRLFAASGAATTGEIVVASASLPSSPPRIAMTPAGEIAVAWEDHQVIYLRRFDRTGQAKGDALVVAPAPNLSRHSPDVALDAAGDAFVVWAVTQDTGDRILLQRLDANDQPLAAAEQVNMPAPFLRDIPRLALGPADSLLVSWNDHRQGGDNIAVWARRYDGPSQTWNAEVSINPVPIGVFKGNAPILYADGEGAVVFNDFLAMRILVRRLDATGNPVGDPIKLGDLGSAILFSPAAAAGPDGTSLVAWQQNDPPLIRAGFFDRSWNPLGDNFLVSSPADDSEWQPAVTAGRTGNFVTAWASAGALIESPLPELPEGAVDGRDGSFYGVFAQRFQPPPCVPSATALCLGGGRFQVQVSWQEPAGATGAGQTVPLSADTGAFWFFDPSNLELMIKVLDARAVNGYFWVYFGSLSNVEFTVTVTDMTTGAVKTYHNPQGVFGSVADDRAFQEAPPATPPAAPAAPAPTPPPAAGRCTPTATTLCTLNRFAVSVDFADPVTGVPTPAQVVPLTGDTGAFWFTDAANLELMVKVLDGRAVNHYFWVFYGALSDQEYTLTVTDTVTGTKRTYHNAAHNLASVADTRAFRARKVN